MRGSAARKNNPGLSAGARWDQAGFFFALVGLGDASCVIATETTLISERCAGPAKRTSNHFEPFTRVIRSARVRRTSWGSAPYEQHEQEQNQQDDD